MVSVLLGCVQKMRGTGESAIVGPADCATRVSILDKQLRCSPGCWPEGGASLRSHGLAFLPFLGVGPFYGDVAQTRCTDINGFQPRSEQCGFVLVSTFELRGGCM